MDILSQYIQINKTLWNKRTETHIQSEFYDVNSFVKGKSSLNNIELDLLGDVKGKKILHLQCHFGQDTLSLSRMGAIATGVDLSDKSIEFANELTSKIGVDATFICCDIFDLKQHLEEKFDIVFTTYGTIGWLPDLNKWADIIAHFLNPQGKLVFADFHPFVWMFDDNFDKITYNYQLEEPIIEHESGTYTNSEANINLQSVGWNHSISEVIMSLMNQNMSLENMQEYDYSPYNCFQNMIEFEKGKYRIEKIGNKIPLVYSLVFVKN